MLTDRRQTTDGRTDPGVTGILLAHPFVFGSGELKIGLEKTQITRKQQAKI